MRTLTVLTLTVLAVAASACATTTHGNAYANEVERLAADCQSRGGILQATGSHTGHAAADNYCKLTDATRIPR
ncbi:MAG: hypothetical protein J0M36_02075 [Caulobacterales bacterium]|nr:hypothetical protein [Caulobacterales bacterium]